MNRQVRTAVIPASGYGTRWLPLTKAVDKCMLPIGNRPVVDYVVEDCVAAGIERIIFTIRKDSTQLRTFYGQNQELEEFLEQRGKDKELEIVRGTGRGLTFEYLAHDDNDSRYGSAVPLHLAVESLASDDAFAVLMSDDFVYRKDDGSELAEAVEAYQGGTARHLMLCTEVAKEEASAYGVLQVDEHWMLKGFIEKPSPEQVPTPTPINISKFIFDKSILKHLEIYMNQPPKQANGEYYLTDLLLAAIAAGEEIQARPIKGEYLDSGTPETWLDANRRVIDS